MPELTDFYHHEISKAMEYFIMAHQWVAKESEVNTDLIIETFIAINEKKEASTIMPEASFFSASYGIEDFYRWLRTPSDEDGICSVKIVGNSLTDPITSSALASCSGYGVSPVISQTLSS